MVRLGQIFPNFTAKTTIGNIVFHDWLKDSWGILFSHPADFTPVCTTELAKLLKLHAEFEKRNTKVIAISCDSVDSHHKWSNDIKVYSGYSGNEIHDLPYPIIADEDRELATELDIIDPDEKDSLGIPVTARAVFIIDSNKKMRLSILYPATTGRNFGSENQVLSISREQEAMLSSPFRRMQVPEIVTVKCQYSHTSESKKIKKHLLLVNDSGQGGIKSSYKGEILRVLDSLQLCDKHKVATPVNWMPGEDVMVQPTVSQDEVKTLFPSLTVVALPSGKDYIRKTPQP